MLDEMRHLRDLSQLTKFPISAASTLTAAAGYVACARTVRLDLGWLLLGTLFMAMGASALNEVQEWALDARMPRTAQRPLPRGVISITVARLTGLGLGALGFTLLCGHGWTPALLGLLAMAWYLGLYTPLKRHSAFAVVPGALIGALPPAMGWTAAGGRLQDPSLLALCFVFFIWQVPHFWLLQTLHGDAYHAGGFPTLARHFQKAQIHRLIFTWMVATAVASVLLVAFRTLASKGAMVLAATAAFWLLLKALRFLWQGEPSQARYQRAFLDINAFALLVIAAVCLDPWL